MTRKEPTAEEQIKTEIARLVHSFSEWEHMRTKGCSDTFWPDGTNMNLVRNHIINGKRRLEELCVGIPLPAAYYIPTPEEVDEDYMAPHGEHYERRMKRGMANMHPGITTKTPAEIKSQQELF